MGFVNESEKAARKRARRTENIVLALCCLLFGGLAFWYASSGGLEKFLLGMGIDLLHTQQEEQAPAEVVPSSGLEAYDWDQISAISAEISAAGDGWRDVALKYGLVAADGTLAGGTKQITLSDGTTFDVQIVGFNHDLRTDGSGVVGISFMSTSCVALRPMNSVDSAAGGWEATELRWWLDREMAAMLPDDVARVIVSVLKPSNNVGRIEAFYQAVPEELVSSTQDMLWIPSAVEVCGPVSWYVSQYGADFQRLDDTINAEGHQYQRFAEAGVTGEGDPAGILTRLWGQETASWWYRTPYCFISDAFYGAMPNGYPHTWTNPGGWQGVVVGFCV